MSCRKLSARSVTVTSGTCTSGRSIVKPRTDQTNTRPRVGSSGQENPPPADRSSLGIVKPVMMASLEGGNDHFGDGGVGRSLRQSAEGVTSEIGGVDGSSAHSSDEERFPIAPEPDFNIHPTQDIQTADCFRPLGDGEGEDGHPTMANIRYFARRFGTSGSLGASPNSGQSHHSHGDDLKQHADSDVFNQPSHPAPSFKDHRPGVTDLAFLTFFDTEAAKQQKAFLEEDSFVAPLHPDDQFMSVEASKSSVDQVDGSGDKLEASRRGEQVHQGGDNPQPKGDHPQERVKPQEDVVGESTN